MALSTTKPRPWRLGAPVPRTATPARRRLDGWVLLAAVVALHLLVLGLLQSALRGTAPPRDEARAPVVLIRTLPPAVTPVEAAPTRAPAPPSRRAPAPSAAAAQPELRRPAAPPATAAAPAPGGLVAPLPPALPASAAAAATTVPLLDTPASREVIRQAAGRASVRELGAAATDEGPPLSEQERMGQEIARGARGDCLKGEYAGAGMGLFSLPFWLVAELRDKCRR
jgi:hypothetical protein